MQSAVESIVDQDTRYALVIRGARAENGVEFFTPTDAELQFGAFDLPQGHVFTPHIHMPFERKLSITTEILIIQEGRLLVQFFRSDETLVCERILEAGDVILLFEGGHGFRVLDSIKMLEVKQGPYLGERDKRKFAHPSGTSY